MPNETSLGVAARCSTLFCDNIVSTGGSGVITATSITTGTLNVSGVSTTTGIVNTGTITTTTLSSTNVNTTNVNLVYDSGAISLNTGVNITTGSVFTSAYNHYRCVVSLDTANTTTYLGGIFLYLTKTTAADVNQFVYTTSYLKASTATTVNNGYYPFLIGWVNDEASYRNDGEWVYTFDIMNSQTASRGAEIKSYNLSYDDVAQPTNISVSGLSDGNLINNGYSYGNGTAGVIGTYLGGAYTGCRVSFTNGFTASGTARLTINGYN